MPSTPFLPHTLVNAHLEPARNTFSPEELEPPLPPAAPRPVLIFNWTRTALPGEAFNLQGEFSARAQVYCSSARHPLPVRLPAATNGKVTAQIEGNVSADIPARRELEVYKVWVQDGDVTAAPVYLNQAWGQYLSANRATKGAVVQLIGRNLQLTAGRSSVSLVPVGGGSTQHALINPQKSTAHRLQLTLPATGPATATTYQVWISNGYGPAVRGEENLTILGGGTDVLRLKHRLPWAGELSFASSVFNTATDARLPLRTTGRAGQADITAINAAIQLAKVRGGGVVEVPAGRYQVLDQGIVMASRVLLRWLPGSSFSVSGNAPDEAYKAAIHFPEGTSYAGVIGARYANRATLADRAPWLNVQARNCHHLLLLDCRFALGESDWLQLHNCQHVALLDTTVQQGINTNSRPRQRGPVRLDGSSYVLCDGCQFSFAVEGLHCLGSHHTFWSNTTFLWDALLGNEQPITNHMLIMGASEQWCVWNSTFRTPENYRKVKNMKVLKLGGRASNDGEAIITEFTGDQLSAVVAAPVTAATATTLSYASLSMPARAYRVRIIAGRGCGQTRTVGARTATQLTVTQPWDVVPGAGSVYNLFPLGARYALIENCRFLDTKRGPTIYYAPVEFMAVVGCRLVRGGSIDFTPTVFGGEPTRLTTQWNVEVVGNVVDGRDDDCNGVFIGVKPVQARQDRPVGMLVCGFVFRRNRLIAHAPNVAAVVDKDFPNGYLNYTDWEPDGRPFVAGEAAVVGTIFEDNEAVNCARPLYVSGGVSNTYVKRLKVSGGGSQVIENKNFHGVQAVRTVEAGTYTGPP